jgi:hypothetical protein
MFSGTGLLSMSKEFVTPIGLNFPQYPNTVGPQLSLATNVRITLSAGLLMTLVK